MIIYVSHKYKTKNAVLNIPQPGQVSSVTVGVSCVPSPRHLASTPSGFHW